MWKRASDLLHDRFRGSGWQEHVRAAQAAEHVTKALQECFPKDVYDEAVFLSFARGVVTLGATHPAVHQAIREDETRFRDLIKKHGTAVDEIRVRIMDSTGSQREP